MFLSGIFLLGRAKHRTAILMYSTIGVQRLQPSFYRNIGDQHMVKPPSPRAIYFYPPPATNDWPCSLLPIAPNPQLPLPHPSQPHTKLNPPFPGQANKTHPSAARVDEGKNLPPEAKLLILSLGAIGVGSGQDFGRGD